MKARIGWGFFGVIASICAVYLIYETFFIGIEGGAMTLLACTICGFSIAFSILGFAQAFMKDDRFGR